MPMMINNALAAYRNAASQGTGQPAPTPEIDQAPGSDFGSMVRDMIDESIEAGHQGEEMTARGIAGQADLSDVVMAVNSAEMSLQMVVGVRDRVIQAYQEIIRMPI
ncbi:flagellar hook-basal body complex protein FliE [Fodinicurvata sp. EGI_FJ10296]|uniref:flagellar hook-basal body complex protein FliE n=1 Tax=Fodinicurvata sp. EGI_FJ10296 TaxID=3231908 RepID=UPI00345670D3